MYGSLNEIGNISSSYWFCWILHRFLCGEAHTQTLTFWGPFLCHVSHCRRCVWFHVFWSRSKNVHNESKRKLHNLFILMGFASKSLTWSSQIYGFIGGMNIYVSKAQFFNGSIYFQIYTDLLLKCTHRIYSLKWHSPSLSPSLTSPPPPPPPDWHGVCCFFTCSCVNVCAGYFLHSCADLLAYIYVLLLFHYPGCCVRGFHGIKLFSGRCRLRVVLLPVLFGLLLEAKEQGKCTHQKKPRTRV